VNDIVRTIAKYVNYQLCKICCEMC